MAQKLILPINDCQLNAGYKSKKYAKEWGFQHYGVDLAERSRQHTLRACGDGMVVACGMDGETAGLRLGNCVVIVYNNVQLPDGRIMSLASRMYHLDSIACRVGDEVKVGTVIGEYGSTGQYSSGPHLHIEFDSDVQYPAYAFGIGKSGKIIKRGSVDSTLDPCKVFWHGKGQSIQSPAEWVAEGWMDADDTVLPSAETAEASEQVIQLQKENSSLKSLVARLHEMTAQ